MLSNKSCLIISGGDFSAALPDTRFDYIIACDRGYSYAKRLNLTPDIIIGDFDSSEKPKSDIPVIEHPVMKDDTDTMLSVRHALEKGFGNIHIICALGGRFDHIFANIQSLAFAAAEGAAAFIHSEDTEISVFSGEMNFPKKEGWSLSCFALSDECTGVSVKGTKFECENTQFSNSFPIGASNVWKENAAAVKCKKGIMMVVESKLKSGEHI